MAHFPVCDDRAIGWKEIFFHIQIGLLRQLRFHDSLVLVQDFLVQPVANFVDKPTKARDRDEFLISTHVHHGILLIDRYEIGDNLQLVDDVVFPHVREDEMQVHSGVGTLHFLGKLGRGAIFFSHLGIELDLAVASFDIWTIDDRRVAPANRVRVDERNMWGIELVFYAA